MAQTANNAVTPVDIDILIGAGDVTLARSSLVEACAAARTEQAAEPWCFRTLAHFYAAEGRRDEAIAGLERYVGLRPHRFAAEVSGYEGELAAELDTLRSGGEIADGFLRRLQPRPENERVSEGALFRALPERPRGNVRFVLIGGPMHYVDRRGEFSCVSSNAIQATDLSPVLAEESGRAITIVESRQWDVAAIGITHRLLETAQRTGHSGAWTYSVGYTTGAFRDAVKAVVARAPTRAKPGSRALRKPGRGRWLYDRDPALLMINCLRGNTLYTIDVPPAVVLWRWPDRSDPMLQAFCDTFASTSSEPLTVVLPDTPGLRDFAVRYVARDGMNNTDRTLLESMLHFATGCPTNAGASATRALARRSSLTQTRLIGMEITSPRPSTSRTRITSCESRHGTSLRIRSFERNWPLGRRPWPPSVRPQSLGQMRRRPSWRRCASGIDPTGNFHSRPQASTTPTDQRPLWSDDGR